MHTYMFKDAQTYTCVHTYMPLRKLTNIREHIHLQTLKCKPIHPCMNVHAQTHMEELELYTHKSTQVNSHAHT